MESIKSEDKCECLQTGESIEREKQILYEKIKDLDADALKRLLYVIHVHRLKSKQKLQRKLIGKIDKEAMEIINEHVF